MLDSGEIVDVWVEADPWGLIQQLQVGGPLIQRDRQAALQRFKPQVEARARQAPGEREKVLLQERW